MSTIPNLPHQDLLLAVVRVPVCVSALAIPDVAVALVVVVADHPVVVTVAHRVALVVHLGVRLQRQGHVPVVVDHVVETVVDRALEVATLDVLVLVAQDAPDVVDLAVADAMQDVLPVTDVVVAVNRVLMTVVLAAVDRV